MIDIYKDPTETKGAERSPKQSASADSQKRQHDLEALAEDTKKCKFLLTKIPGQQTRPKTQPNQGPDGDDDDDGGGHTHYDYAYCLICTTCAN